MVVPWRFLVWQLVLVAVVLSLVSPVRAADMAEYRVLGYSQDGRHFAFEQYGIQDGSGFAFSDVFVLDLETDTWMPGSPYRERADDETTSLEEVRAAAVARAMTDHAALGFMPHFRMLASASPLEFPSREASLGFYPRPILDPIDPLHTLTLNVLPMESPRDCFGMVETAGFEVLLEVDGQGMEVVHRDQRLPSSRACPADYGLAAVLAPFNGAAGRAVALISVYQLGFEGLDRRFLAVPLDLSF